MHSRRSSSDPPQPRAAEVGLGVVLKRAREAKGLSIDDLMRATKIRRPILAALEAQDVAHLPAAIYTRGFVRAYAREVGLDPDATANTYLAEVDLVPPAPPPAHVAPVSATRDELMALDDDNEKILATQQVRRLGGFVTFACAIGLVVYVWSFSRQQAETMTRATAAPVSDVDATRAVAPPENPPDAVAAERAIDELAGPLQLELRPAGLCWIVVTADGAQVLARLFRDGEQQTITANDEVTLRIGDPGALTYSINGRAGRPLGRAGEVVNVRITRQNVREFIAES